MSHVFRHPKYYEELRKRAKEKGTRAAPDPIVVTEEDLKALEEIDKQQATSVKPQADKVSSRKRQASSPEQQAASDKPQAASSKISEPL